MKVRLHIYVSDYSQSSFFTCNCGCMAECVSFIRRTVLDFNHDLHLDTVYGDVDNLPFRVFDFNTSNPIVSF